MNKEYFVPFTKFESEKVNLYVFKPRIDKDLREICGTLDGFRFYTCWKLPIYVVNGNPSIKEITKSGIQIQYTK